MTLDYFDYLARESVTFYPNGVTADAIECDGVTVRSPLHQSHDNLIRTAEVWIPRGNLAGKVSAINKGKDELLVKVRPYSPQVRCKVIRILDGDLYAWHIVVAQ